MDIGKLNKMISIYKASPIDDGMGSTSIDYIYSTSVFANVKEKSVNKDYTENNLESTKKIKFTMRKIDIPTDYRIKYNNIIYNIDTLYNDEKFTYIECYEK